jgi:hypothetical protein
MVSCKLPAVIAISCLANTNAFVAPREAQSTSALSMSSSSSNDNENVVSRRVAFTKSAATFASIASIAAGNPDFAFAARSPPTEAELARIKTGYERMSYLLENFEKETTVCRVSFVILYYNS